MIKELNEVIKHYISFDMAGTLYLGAGFIFAAWYIPQIIRLVKDTTGAAAISLNTLFFQLLLRVPGLVYGIMREDAIVFSVIFTDVIARIIILILASHKRFKFHKSVLGDDGLFQSFVAVDIDEQLIDSEKHRRHSSKATHEEVAKKMKLDNDYTDTTITTKA